MNVNAWRNLADEAERDALSCIGRNRTAAYSVLVFLGFLIFVAPLMGGLGAFEASGHVGVPVAYLNWTWLIPGGIVWCLIAAALWYASKHRQARTPYTAPLRFCRACDASLPSGAHYCDQCRTPVTALTERIG